MAKVACMELLSLMVGSPGGLSGMLCDRAPAPEFPTLRINRKQQPLDKYNSLLFHTRFRLINGENQLSVKYNININGLHSYPGRGETQSQIDFAATGWRQRV